MPINVINVVQIGLYECFYIPQRNYEAIDNQCRHDFFLAEDQMFNLPHRNVDDFLAVSHSELL